MNKLKDIIKIEIEKKFEIEENLDCRNSKIDEKGNIKEINSISFREVRYGNIEVDEKENYKNKLKKIFKNLFEKIISPLFQQLIIFLLYY